MRLIQISIEGDGCDFKKAKTDLDNGRTVSLYFSYFSGSSFYKKEKYRYLYHGRSF